MQIIRYPPIYLSTLQKPKILRGYPRYLRFPLRSNSFSFMDSTKAEEVDYNLAPAIQISKNGGVERILGTKRVPALLDAVTRVSSKDAIIDPRSGLSARLYLPKIIDLNEKLPLLIYLHGDGFVTDSTFFPLYRNYLSSLVSQGNIVFVSVDYKLSPEYSLPIGHDDFWEIIRWVFSASNKESWLRGYRDFDREFLVGDSAKANLSHKILLQAKDDDKVNMLGVVNMYFWGTKRIGSEDAANHSPFNMSLMTNLWTTAYQTSKGIDGPRNNPFSQETPSLSGLACEQVLISVAKKYVVKDRGLFYYETLEKSGWRCKFEIEETKEENHVFHLYNPTC
ncbi:hypothetical protein GIB67_016201 [Kingdonia uniflora]|uniref:Alpha/beta hydrolase fold-3 domain-containing protein n=1 Tax=Kingdonia uniflora TaxID=39325 RepID=A0A7J7LT93_9MAGN|nr:hypothetical protein GIB67_016201 [Kingdonia uniflora]